LLNRCFIALFLLLAASSSWGHDLSADNARFVQNLSGVAVGPFLYLGAKHMVTGVDHLLFLLGVIFFLRRARDIALYVTLFTVGHSTTLILGVMANWQVNAYLIDAIIGLSVAYKGFENIGGFRVLLGRQFDPRLAVLLFGLCHGLGLATKIQDYAQGGDALLVNLLSFNVGVELGQLSALAGMLLVLYYWRVRPHFEQQAFVVNALLILAGFMLFGFQLTGYVLS